MRGLQEIVAANTRAQLEHEKRTGKTILTKKDGIPPSFILRDGVAIDIAPGAVGDQIDTISTSEVPALTFEEFERSE